MFKSRTQAIIAVSKVQRKASEKKRLYNCRINASNLIIREHSSRSDIILYNR